VVKRLLLIFSASGISVYIADLEAKKLMDSPKIKNAILAILGHSDSNHSKRAKLAEIVF
jgi:hypothetical protein